MVCFPCSGYYHDDSNVLTKHGRYKLFYVQLGTRYSPFGGITIAQR
jgi:hypothetical protein